MTPNVGTVDRIVRVLIAAMIGVLYWQGVISGTLGTVLAVLAVIFVLTSAISFCPLYSLVGLSTCPRR